MPLLVITTPNEFAKFQKTCPLLRDFMANISCDEYVEWHLVLDWVLHAVGVLRVDFNVELVVDTGIGMSDNVLDR